MYLYEKLCENENTTNINTEDGAGLLDCLCDRLNLSVMGEGLWKSWPRVKSSLESPAAEL